jgi:hypothetical protein
MTKNTRKSAGKPRLANQPEPVGVLAALAGLRAMTVPELQAKWAAIFDAPAPNASRGNLELRLGYRLQELALGGLGREARRTLDALADEVANGAPGPMVADPRRPMPGTRLVRDWEGVEHSVTVRADGFEWQGRRFKSLSAAARAITGTNRNGWKFFGLAHGASAGFSR